MSAWKSLVVPAVDSRWDRPQSGSIKTVRVMGCVEGYVVARFSGSMPFLVHMSDWYLTYRPKVMPQRRSRSGAVSPTLDDVNGEQ